MIRILQIEGRSAPMLICDICNQPIEDIGLGAAVFPHTHEEGESVEVLHVHKRACHDAAERRLAGEKHAPWHELRDHLVYLMANSGVSGEELTKRAAALRSMDEM